ncbi:MAG: carboxypeptidase regulatory-like domain-containing protein [Gemmatimonadaceae bacterium]|nr:carboxypeptidase regulatory-like domain-containing protein [Gemmatimonadaceae bacterium]
MRILCPRYAASLYGLVLLLLLPRIASAQATAETLRGRVADDSARSVNGASVFVTRSTDRSVQQVVSDSEGRWSVRFEEGSGDYLVFVSAPGFQSVRRRIQRQDAEREFVVDVVLVRAGAAQLTAVRVQAQGKPRPDNGVRLGSEEVGASDRWMDGVTAALPPTVRGDLTAMQATVGNVVAGADGASLLGASSTSNLTTLNGTALPAGQLPRGAPVDIRYSAGSMDATRGGFAGGQVDVRLAAGNRDIQRRRMWGTLSPELLQASDHIGRASGATAGMARLSASADGEAIRRALTYNVSADYARTASDPTTLVDADPTLLRAVGLVPDSAARLLALNGTQGPAPGNALTRSTDTWSILGRLDDTRDTTRVLALTTFASGTLRNGIGASPQLSPNSTMRQSDLALNVQLLNQRTVRRLSAFNENRLALTHTQSNTQSRGIEPTALVVTDMENGGLAVLGASPMAGRDRNGWTAEGASEWAWLAGRDAPGVPGAAAHRFKAIAWLRADGVRDASVPDAFGTWRFASLADYANGVPALYTRTISQPVRSGTAWNSALALSHQWRASPSVHVLSGVRVEGNMMDGASTPSIARVHASPRLGVTWNVGRGDPRSAQMNASYGTVVRPTMGVLRAGIGEFRDLYSAGTLADLRESGDAANAISLLCVGDAAPLAPWNSSGAPSQPTQCRDGSGLGQRVASLRTLSPQYDVPSAWRGYVNYARNVGPFLGRVEVMGAINRALPSVVDRNLIGTPVFTLSDEGRAIYVSPGSIDSRSGAVSPRASRVDDALGLVHEVRSDLRSEAGQLSFGLTTDMFRWRTQYYALTWTLQSVRQQYRGADGGNYGDPRAIEWARGVSDARHIMQLQAAYPMPRRLGTFTLFTRLQSGLPFTPIVRGDIDGDGTPGDRAFVFDPAVDRMPERAAAMQALLQGADPHVRRCLESQLGRVATRQGCSGPWTLSSNARLDFDVPMQVAGRRLRAALNIENLASGADLLLNGDNPRGWGNPAAPDPVLLVPRGFDGNGERFDYAVNPRFGSTRPGNTLLRTPFRVALDFSLDFTRPIAEQRLARTLEPVRRNGTWQSPTVEDMQRVLTRQVSSVHRVLLAFSDTLFLTRDQIDRLRTADSVFQQEARALYHPLAARLSALQRPFDVAAALSDIRATEFAYQRRFWAQQDPVRQILTPMQLDVMPQIIKMIMAYQPTPDPQRWPRWFFADDGSSAGVGPPP